MNYDVYLRKLFAFTSMIWRKDSYARTNIGDMFFDKNAERKNFKHSTFIAIVMSTCHLTNLLQSLMKSLILATCVILSLLN